jgi:hypothetical protein
VLEFIGLLKTKEAPIQRGHFAFISPVDEYQHDGLSFCAMEGAELAANFNPLLNGICPLYLL